jgi:hypothetical protein
MTCATSRSACTECFDAPLPRFEVSFGLSPVARVLECTVVLGAEAPAQPIGLLSLLLHPPRDGEDDEHGDRCNDDYPHPSFHEGSLYAGA